MSTRYFDKDPEARLIYSVDWTSWLTGTDLVANSTFTVSTVTNDSANIVIHNTGIQSGNIAYVELSGGSAGNTYTLTNHITTSDGYRDARRFKLKVNPRYL